MHSPFSESNWGSSLVAADLFVLSFLNWETDARFPTSTGAMEIHGVLVLISVDELLRVKYMIT